MPFVIALVAAAILTPAAIAAGARTGFVDLPAPEPPGVRIAGRPLLKIHSRPISQLGGLAVVAATGVAVAATGAPTPVALVAGIALATALGTLDDARPLPPAVRTAILTISGVLVAVGGARLEPLGAVAAPATVLAVLASANAVNLVDGQDGLAAGVVAIGALGLAAIDAIGGGTPALALGLSGALVAFLFWNREPATVFLGNGGAYGVGVTLAIAATRASASGPGALAAVAVCLGVVEFELIATVVRRLRGGARLTEGDRGHTYDVLAARLGSRRRSTWWCWGAAAACAATGVLLAVSPIAGAAAVALGGIAAVATRRRIRKGAGG